MIPLCSKATRLLWYVKQLHCSCCRSCGVDNLCCKAVKVTSWLVAFVQVLSTSCSKISDRKLLEQSGKAILQTLKACQGARTTISLKVSSNRFYTAGFRALSTILATLRSQHGLSTAELVELLRHFFTHGLELSLASTVTPAAVTFGQGSLRDGAAAGSARYRPPHARRRSSSSNAGKVGTFPLRTNLGVDLMLLCARGCSMLAV